MTVKKIILILYCTLLSYQISAETVVYDHTGIIDAVSLGENIIIMDDTAFRIASYTKLHRNKKEYPHVYSVRNLEPGMPVEFNINTTGNPPVITELRPGS